MAKPEVDLSTLFEGSSLLRSRAREQGQLTCWVKPEAVGIASQKAAALNSEALEILGGWWAPQTLQPTSVPINILRPEARGWKLIKYSLYTELDNWGSWFILWALTNTQKPFPP